VKPLRVKAPSCAMECRWLQTTRLDDLDGKATQRYVVFGRVIGVHIDDRFIKNGLVDTGAMRPIARAGHNDYFVSTPETQFSIRRPMGGSADHLDKIKVAAE
jgi:flavin reductase (DIM6/NTAB) family NADH-FMN oxidoreductase RutF